MLAINNMGNKLEGKTAEDHALRHLVNDEIHGRAGHPVKAPARVVYLAYVVTESDPDPLSSISALCDFYKSIRPQDGALCNGGPFSVMPDAFRRLQVHLLKRLGGDREMVDILALVLQHEEQAVLSAVELALEAGVPSKTHILNLLHRLVDAKRPAPDIDAPQALNLGREPRANVERYDALRASRAGRGMRHAS